MTASAPPAAAAAGVRSVLLIKMEPNSFRVRSVLRFRPSPEWTADEDAQLERLAKDNGFKHWRRVAREMPGRSPKQCRDRLRDHLARDLFHRPFTAADDEELQRLFLRHGGRWKEVRRAVHGRTSRVLRRRWKEIRNGDAFLTKLWKPTTDAAASSQLPFPPPPPPPALPAWPSNIVGTLAPGINSCMPVF